jgi:uncharacterized protein YoaH (UPF0181 family)
MELPFDWQQSAVEHVQDCQPVGNGAYGIRKFSGAAIVLIARFVFVTGKQEQGIENFL